MKVENEAMANIRSNRGSALLLAVITVLVASFGIALTYNMSVTTAKLSRSTRVKIAMASVETRVRLLAASTSGYIGCVSTNPAGSCQADLNHFQELRRAVAGSRCPGDGDFCGVDITNVQYSGATNTFRATISYTGLELSIKPISLALKVPPEILQEVAYTCPSTAPIFIGYNANNSIKCAPLSASCPPGQYIYQVNPGTLQVTCKAVEVVGCNNQLISQISFSSGKFTRTCTPQRNAFDFWGFAPSVVVGP